MGKPLGGQLRRTNAPPLEPVPHKHIGPADTPTGPKFSSGEYRFARLILRALRGADTPNLAVQRSSCTYCSDSSARQQKNLLRARRALRQYAQNVQAKPCTGKLAERPCRDYFKAGGQFNLNNLYGLTQVADRRQLFWPVPAGWRRVWKTLFVYWDHLHEFSDQFSTQS